MHGTDGQHKAEVRRSDHKEPAPISAGLKAAVAVSGVGWAWRSLPAEAQLQR